MAPRTTRSAAARAEKQFYRQPVYDQPTPPSSQAPNDPPNYREAKKSTAPAKEGKVPGRVSEKSDDDLENEVHEEVDESAEEPTGDDDGESETEQENKVVARGPSSAPRSSSTNKDKDPDNFVWANGISSRQEPFDTIEKMYQALLNKCLKNDNFKAFLESTKVLRVATMCSGSECPIIALEMAEELLTQMGLTMRHQHCFSAEIVPFKQAYIRRNWPNVTIFRDIVELGKLVNPEQSGPDKVKRAKTDQVGEEHVDLLGTTAYGSKVAIPEGLDILVAGFCCVDFSKLNVRTRNLEYRGESGDTLYAILSFAEKQRPKLILLENVQSAPWENHRIRMKHLQKEAGKTSFTFADFEKYFSALSPVKRAALDAKVDKKIESLTYDVGIDLLMRKIGYAAKYVQLDAKDYYIPQTRDRGYMLCVDVNLFGSPYMQLDPKSGKRKADGVATSDAAWRQAEKHLKAWHKQVLKLKQPATVSAEHLLQNATGMASSSISRVDTIKKERIWPWVSSKADHDKYRFELELGSERRLTLWNEAGYKLLPDFWTAMSGMTQRILDVLEINHLRGLRRGFDDRYYNRLLDLSQNVFRNTDNTKSGIISCLTPNGIPWTTANGRRLRGRESLLLQGLPVNRIDLSYLTEDNMQDLTGNAMTSTVVAAAILAAFATFHQVLEGVGQVNQAVETFPGLDLEQVNSITVNPSLITQCISVEDAKLLASLTNQLCSCEDSGLSDNKIWKCRVCSHTVCTDHKGNPRHNYNLFEPEGTRVSPSKFVDRIKKAVPRYITLPVDFSSILQQMFSDEKATKDSGLKITDVETVPEFPLLLTSFERSSIWEIIFESSRAKLVLKISANGVEWLLYAKPPTQLALTDKTRTYCEQFPLARLQPHRNDITRGEWEFWKPDKRVFKINLTFSGNLMPSFESRRGMVRYADTYVFEQFKICGDGSISNKPSPLPEDLKSGSAKPKSLSDKSRSKSKSKFKSKFSPDPDHESDPESEPDPEPESEPESEPEPEPEPFPNELKSSFEGVFKLSEDCGQAYNSLHYREGEDVKNSDDRLFFMFEHQLQCGNPTKHYHVLTRDLRKLPFGIHRQIAASLPSGFETPMIKKSSDPHALHKYQKTNRSQILKGGVGVPFEEKSIKQPCTITVHGSWVPTTATLRIDNVADGDIQKLIHDFSAWGDLSCQDLREIFRGKIQLPEDSLREFSTNTWILVGPKNESAFFGRFGHLFDRELILEPYTQDGKKGPLWINVTHPTEMCLSCAPTQPTILWTWESEFTKQGVKKKSALKAFEDLEDTGDYEIKLKSRPSAMQALYKISGDNMLEMVIRVNPATLIHRALSILMDNAEYENERTSWGLVTNDRTTLNRALGNYLLKSTANSQEPLGLAPLAKDYTLRREQVLTVSWAVMQEDNPQTFVEEEVVESRLSKLNYCLMGKAEREVTRRGGVLASEVGYGKTAVVLALANNQSISDKARVDEEAKKNSGLVPIKATLILMPGHLVDQWVSEVGNFLSSTTNILPVKNISTLRSRTIADMQEYDFIVMSWNVCSGQAYMADLAELAGMLRPPIKTSRRAMSCWYQECLEKVKENMNELRRHHDTFVDFLSKKIKEQQVSTSETQRMLPSKRLVGSQLQRAKIEQKMRSSSVPRPDTPPKTEKPKQTFPSKRKGSPSEDWHDMKGIVLELFSFTRIVVDEYHYADDDVQRTIQGLDAYAKWLLSGTPLLSGFASIKSMAALIGIKLGTDDYVSMPTDVFKKAVADMTATERFLTYESPPSSMWLERRDEIAQRFLDQFLREDKADIGEIESNTHTRVYGQSAIERAAYIDAEYQLAVNELLVPSQTKIGSDYDIQLRSIFESQKYAQEASLWRAAYFNYSLKANKDDYLVVELATENDAGDNDAGEDNAEAEGSDNEDSQDKVDTKSRDVVESNDAEEDPPNFCDRILKIREERYLELRTRTEKVMQDAEILQADHLEIIEITKDVNNSMQYIEFKRRMKEVFTADIEIEGRHYRMSEVVDSVEAQAKPADVESLEFKETLAAAKKSSQGKLMRPVEVELRAAARQLNRLLVELTKQARLIRRARVVGEIQKAGNTNASTISCEQCAIPKGDMRIIWQCGHLMCERCILNGQTVCYVPGCGGTTAGCDAISGREFAVEDVPYSTKYGCKIGYLINLVKRMRQRGEKALLFVQDKQAIEQVSRALQTSNVAATRLDGSKDCTEGLKDFLQGHVSVLILNIGDASAAGLNLTVANNVIFFAPYMTRGSAAQTTYTAAMTQAVGRAKRFGQKKKVHIYHLLVAKTFDVDLYEDRNQCVLTRGSDDTIAKMPCRDVNGILQKSDFGSHLADVLLGRIE